MKRYVLSKKGADQLAAMVEEADREEALAVARDVAKRNAELLVRLSNYDGPSPTPDSDS